MSAVNCYHPQPSIVDNHERDGIRIISFLLVGAPYSENGKRFTNRVYTRYRHRSVFVLYLWLLFRNELSAIDFERLYFKESFLKDPWKEAAL